MPQNEARHGPALPRDRTSESARHVPDQELRRVHPALVSLGGTALDVAGGAGRHAVYLAERAWRVTSADISESGVERARSPRTTM